MANQISINIGAAANDGTGDPLRTAFNDVNLNFANVWSTGLPNSNVQFSDNRILTTNTNANLVLAPNGIGIVQSNVDIIPSINRVQSLGTLTKKWNSVNSYYINADSANIGSFGNLTVAVANLHISGGSNGYVLQTDGTGNLTWTAQTGGSGNGVPGGANTQVQYNNAGSFGGDANFLFFNTSGALQTAGNVFAHANVSHNLGSPIRYWDHLYVSNASVSNNIFVLGNITASRSILVEGDFSANNATIGNITTSQNLYANVGTFYGDQYSDGAIFVGNPAGTVLGSDVVMQITANAAGYSQTNFQNISNSITASSDYILTADNGNNVTHFLDMGITSSGWDGSETNVLSGLVANNGYLYVQDGNLTVGTRAGNVSHGWNFDTEGTLTFPNNSGSGWPVDTQRFGMGNIGAWLDGEWTIGEFSGNGVSGTVGIRIDPAIEGYTGITLPGSATSNTQPVSIYSVNGSGIQLYTGGGEWLFDANGTTLFPTLTVNLHNGGTQTGQTLQFGDPTQQAFITGPAPEVEGYAAQRLIIQGQYGNTGEGGDVYIWGGDSQVNGGDIKIYAGDADVAGRGGNIHVAGGRGTTNAGEITLTGGQNDDGVGAYVGLTGGRGSSTGGNVSLNGGYGDVNGGPINITGGIGGNGLGSYGNVNINAGASTWTFDNTGNLALPAGGVVYETNIPFGGLPGKTIALAPYGGTSADQQLLVYPTAGPDANHLHLTSGNLYNTELFLGNDNLYVKLANTGNIVINANDSVGNTAQWTFGIEGTILNSGNLTIQTPSGIPSSLANWNGGGGWNQGSYIDLATTGGTGTGLTVDVAAGGGGYISINEITIHTPGTGYTNGDVITITNENELSGTFTVSVVNNQWIFDTTGIATLPGEGVLQSISDSVTLRSLNTTSGNANSVYLGSGGGLGFNDQEIGGNWLEIFRTGTEPEIRVPVGRGNLNIQTAQGETPYNWVFDNTGNLTAPGNISAVGNIASGNLSVTGNITGNTAGFAIGYRDIPQVSLSSNVTTALTDAGKHYYSVSASNLALTIANNASVVWPVGTAISIVNRGTANITIAGGTGVSLYLAGNSTAGNRTVTTYGMATVMNVAANIWMISGTVV